jgi:hypothetical protein
MAVIALRGRHRQGNVRRGWARVGIVVALALTGCGNRLPHAQIVSAVHSGGEASTQATTSSGLPAADGGASSAATGEPSTAVAQVAPGEQP